MDKEYTPGEAKAWLNGYDEAKRMFSTKKEWIRLTNEEISEIREQVSTRERGLIITPEPVFAREIEKALKEKNS